MKDWYYQIKGKLGTPEQGMWGSNQNWSWPPIYAGKVTAIDRKAAVIQVQEQYGVKFPTRVLQKDIESHEFLMSISEIDDQRTARFFIERDCIHCQTTFKIINHYNNHNQRYKGSDYCSDECKQESYEVARYIDSGKDELSGIHPAVIYKVYNNVTGLCYIGKTTQAFTLRWYQHFYQTGDTKFHKAIKSGKLSDWTFTVIEKIVFPDDCKTKSACESYIFEREKHYIKLYDCVNNGYNTVC